jgi:large subunit ribosomal protein L15
LPLIRRLARKRGFVNIFRVEYTPVNLSRLDRFVAGSTISPESLQEAGIVKDSGKPIKILADGDITKSLTVQAHKFSRAAQEKIEAAGGRVEVVA